MSNLRCISYKEVNLLYDILKQLQAPYYLSYKTNILSANEPTLANLLFNYRLLAFVENDAANPSVVLLQLPSVDETNTVEVLLLSKFVPEFWEAIVEHIKKDFEDFGWNRIIIEYRTQTNTDVKKDREIRALGFTKNFYTRCNESCFRNMASIILTGRGCQC